MQAEERQELLAEKQGVMQAILEVARQQLAMMSGEFDSDALDAAFMVRDDLMARVEQINEALGCTGAEKDEAIRSVLLEINAMDQQIRQVIVRELSQSGEQMRATNKIKQGLSAYIGTPGQAESLYIDKKQ